jgi:hypothetical protein
MVAIAIEQTREMRMDNGDPPMRVSAYIFAAHVFDWIDII